MIQIDTTSFLDFFHGFPCLMSSLHITFEISIYDIGHTLGKFPDSSQTDTISVDEFLMVQFIDERQDIPEEIAHFELELIVIFLC